MLKVKIWAKFEAFDVLNFLHIFEGSIVILIYLITVLRPHWNTYRWEDGNVVLGLTMNRLRFTMVIWNKNKVKNWIVGFTDQILLYTLLDLLLEIRLRVKENREIEGGNKINVVRTNNLRPQWKVLSSYIIIK